MTKAELRAAKKKYRLKRAFIRFAVWSCIVFFLFSVVVLRCRTKESLLRVDIKVCTAIECVLEYHSHFYIFHFDDGESYWMPSKVFEEELPVDIEALIINEPVRVIIEKDFGKYRILYDVYSLVGLEHNGEEILPIRKVIEYRHRQMMFGFVTFGLFLYAPSWIILFWEVQEYYRYFMDEKKRLNKKRKEG